MFVVILGDSIVIEADGERLSGWREATARSAALPVRPAGHLHGSSYREGKTSTRGSMASTGDYFGEEAALFSPGTFHESDGTPLDGHRRRFSAYATKEPVTLGTLTYESLQQLRRDREAISAAIVPYTNRLAEALAVDELEFKGKKATMLDCYPGLGALDERLERIEALLLAKA